LLPDHANRHLLQYWDRCRTLFANRDYPLAAFCAITLIEEVGKVTMLTLQGPEENLDSKDFWQHRKKYKNAVGATLFVNSRVSRIYGEREHLFARWFRENELIRIRNNALYMEVDGENIVTPEQMLSQDTSFLLVCFAGEVLAEIQGEDMTNTGPQEWARLLGEVDEFRKRYDTPS